MAASSSCRWMMGEIAADLPALLMSLPTPLGVKGKPGSERKLYHKSLQICMGLHTMQYAPEKGATHEDGVTPLTDLQINFQEVIDALVKYSFQNASNL